MTTVTRISRIDASFLDPAHYTESLLAAGTEAGLLTFEDAQRIPAALLDLLADRLSHLTKNKSCTVRTEIAQLQLQNVLYVLDTYLLTVAYPDDALKQLSEVPLSEIYEKGQKCIRRRILACEMQYKRMLPVFTALPQGVFRKTAVEGMEAFFKQYHPDTWPCEIHITADYPLYLPCDTRLSGISFIAAYLQGMTEEAQLLSRIQPDILKRILSADDRHWVLNADNLFRPVFATLIGMILLQKPFPLWKRGLASDDLAALDALYPTEEMLASAVDTLSDLLMLGEHCTDYCRRAAVKLCAEYRSAQQYGVLKRIFPLITQT